jgi:hypothetical protein
VFFQADEALVADDDVVDQLDVQDAPGRQELFRRLDILWLWLRVAAGILFQRMSPWKLRILAGRKITAVRKSELLMVP